jgi:heat shock protein HslJ
MRKLRTVLKFIMLALVLIACQEDEPAPTPVPDAPAPPEMSEPTQEPDEEPITKPAFEEPEDIVGIVWQWEAFQDTAGQNDIEVDDPTRYTVTLLPDGRASIKAECNMVTMGYSLEGHSIIFVGPGISTLAACPPDSLDSQYLALINDVATWVMSPEDKLVFNLIADAGNMIFLNGGAADVPEPMVDEAVDITGIVWQWEAFVDTADLNSILVDDPSRYTVTLLPEGQASIKADCNMVSMGYELDGSSISFTGPGISTMAMCPPDSLDQQFLGFLENVVTWVMGPEDKLVFNLFADAGNMIFNNGGPAEEPPTASIEDIQNIVWLWSGLVETEPAAQSVVPNPENYSIIFLPDGSAPTTADCNQVGGSYGAEGSSLTIVIGPSTRAFCGEDSLDQQYLALLSTVASFDQPWT